MQLETVVTSAGYKTHLSTYPWLWSESEWDGSHSMHLFARSRSLLCCSRICRGIRTRDLVSAGWNTTASSRSKHMKGHPGDGKQYQQIRSVFLDGRATKYMSNTARRTRPTAASSTPRPHSWRLGTKHAPETSWLS